MRAGSRFGTRSSAARIAAAPRSSGGCPSVFLVRLPTAVRTDAMIYAFASRSPCDPLYARDSSASPQGAPLRCAASEGGAPCGSPCDEPHGCALLTSPPLCGDSAGAHRAGGVPPSQFRSGFPFISMNWIRAWVFSSPHSDRNASRSSEAAPVRSVCPRGTSPPVSTEAIILPIFRSCSLICPADFIV